MKKTQLGPVILLISAVITYRQLAPLLTLIKTLPLNDFSVYLDGITTTLNNQNPYKLWFFDRYNYSPAATFLLLPLVSLPVNWAEFLFTAFSILSLWLTTTISFSLLKYKTTLPIKLLIFSLMLKLYPVKLTLILGQINLIILFLIITSFYCYQKNKSAASGTLLGLATILKLTPAPLILFFVLKKKWGILKWFLATLILFSAAGIIFFKFDLTSYYYLNHLPQLVSETAKQFVKTDYMNQGMAALLARFQIFGSTATIIRYLISTSFLIYLSRQISKTTNFSKLYVLFSLLVITAILFLPLFVWQHHFVFVIPALFALLALKSWPKALFGYILINFYFQNSGIPPTLHPLAATHFLIATTITSLLLLRSKK